MFGRCLHKAVLVLLAFAVLSIAAWSEQKSGKCTLKARKDKSKETSDTDVVIKLGETVKAEARFFIDSFFGVKIINADATLKNTSEKPMHAAYFVAFFDKDGKLLGCSGQTTMEAVAPGESEQFGSVLIAVPEDVIKQVASYQVTLYESEKEIGIKMFPDLRPTR